ncbi:MAG: DUF2490 domain-containing protein [Bacteroidales bacterium]|nr:DUF2490 domain-containing protein [Bacteroidales bacterium]
MTFLKTPYKLLLLATICFCGLLINNDVKGQNNNNAQLWIDFYPTFYIKPHLQYYGDAGYRTQLSSSRWKRIYARPSVRYHHRGIQFEGGIGFFYFSDIEKHNRFEVTPWQGVQTTWPKLPPSFQIKHRFKLEERFSYMTTNWSSSFDMRLRYKLAFTYKANASGKFSKWSIPVSAEFFIPVNDGIDEFFSNRLRLGAGLGYKHNKDWKFVIQYVLQQSKSSFNDAYRFSDHAIQLKIIKNWYTKK